MKQCLALTTKSLPTQSSLTVAGSMEDSKDIAPPVPRLAEGQRPTQVRQGGTARAGLQPAAGAGEAEDGGSVDTRGDVAAVQQHHRAEQRAGQGDPAVAVAGAAVVAVTVGVDPAREREMRHQGQSSESLDTDKSAPSGQGVLAAAAMAAAWQQASSTGEGRGREPVQGQASGSGQAREWSLTKVRCPRRGRTEKPRRADWSGLCLPPEAC